MNTEQTRVFGVRLDTETIQRVEQFAVRTGLIKDSGTLNVSAALRVLISAGLELPKEQVTAELWRSAKGVVMREVVDNVLKTLKDYRDTYK